jgi:hypothetical protein
MDQVLDKILIILSMSVIVYIILSTGETGLPAGQAGARI